MENKEYSKWQGLYEDVVIAGGSYVYPIGNGEFRTGYRSESNEKDKDEKDKKKKEEAKKKEDEKKSISLAKEREPVWKREGFESYIDYLLNRKPYRKADNYVMICPYCGSNPPCDCIIAKVEFSPGIDSSYVSQKSMDIIAKIATASNNDKVVITSTMRSPEKQAQVMYDYTQKTGMQEQYNLYGRNGDKIIDVYKENKSLSRQEVISLMTNKINELGPSNVSKHCGNHKILNVFDISILRLNNPNDFYNEAKKHVGSDIYNLIYEPKRNCYHFEIKQ